MHAFKMRTQTTYVVTFIVDSEKVFYADNIKNNLETEMFDLLDVSIEDLDKVKVGARFINRTGYIDSPSGTRSKVCAQLEFLED